MLIIGIQMYNEERNEFHREDHIGTAANPETAKEFITNYINKHREHITEFTGYADPFVFTDKVASGVFSDNLIAVSRSQNCNFFVKRA